MPTSEDKIHKPISCCIVPSIECFFKCKMCHLWKSRPEPDKINPEEWQNFIDSLSGLLDDRKELIFSGGEPLLNKDITALISYANKKGLRTVLSTNAFLIDGKKAEELVAAGLKEIYISLDSFNEKTHDFLRGVEGSHKKATDAIGHLNKYRSDLKVNVITVLSGCNLHEISGHVKKLSGEGMVGGVYFQAIAQPFYTEFEEYWQQKEEYSFLWPQDLKAVHDALDILIEFKSRNYPIINQLQHLEKFRSYFENPNLFVTKSRCYLGDYSININPNGNIFLCGSLGPVGNIRKDDINRLWFSDRAQEKREQMYKCAKNCHNMVNCFFLDKEERPA